MNPTPTKHRSATASPQTLARDTSPKARNDPVQPSCFRPFVYTLLTFALCAGTALPSLHAADAPPSGARPATSTASELAKQWLDDYFTVFNAQVAERESFVASKRPDLKDALQARQKYFEADEAMYRYLFVWHIQHATGLLQWNDGDWIMNIGVCNCGVEGSVPTPEFQKLFETRSKALVEMEKSVPDKISDEIQKLRRQMPDGWKDAYTARISRLKDRFDWLIQNTPVIKDDAFDRLAAANKACAFFGISPCDNSDRDLSALYNHVSKLFPLKTKRQGVLDTISELSKKYEKTEDKVKIEGIETELWVRFYADYKGIRYYYTLTFYFPDGNELSSIIQRADFSLLSKPVLIDGEVVEYR